MSNPMPGSKNAFIPGGTDNSGEYTPPHYDNPAPMPGAPSSSGATDTFEVDLTNVSSGFVIPDGVYRVRCIEVEQGVSKGGNPMFVWTFVIPDGEHAGFELKNFTAMTPAAMWKVAECVTALGVGQIGQTVKFKRSDVLNRECGAVVEKSEYNGQERSQIRNLVTLQDMASMMAKG